MPPLHAATHPDTHLPHAACSVEALLTGTQEEARSDEAFSR